MSFLGCKALCEEIVMPMIIEGIETRVDKETCSHVFSDILKEIEDSDSPKGNV